MKKLLFISAVLAGGMLNAQTYPLIEHFDAVSTSGTPATGALPTGWTTGANSTFMVYGMENLGAIHGDSPNNACSVEMNASHTADTLITPLIGSIGANTKVGISYRFVNKAGYPSTGYQLVAGDKISIDAYLGTSWTNVATFDNTTNPTATNAYTNYSYICSICGTIAGFYPNVKVRIDVARAAGSSDWYLDIDDFQVADNLVFMGIKTNSANAPQLSIFPNPSNGNFTILLKNYQGNNHVDVNVYDVIGKKVKTISAEGAVNNQLNVNTLGLEKGLYFVEVKSGSEVATTKIQID